MADVFEKNIDGAAAYQLNHFTCWAAVALTAYRAKHGKTGKGASLYSLFGQPGGEHYLKMVEFAEELHNHMQATGANLLGAKDAVVKAHPQFKGIPDGLGTLDAEPFFRNFMKMRISRLVDGKASQPGSVSKDDKAAVKALIKTSGPLVIFTSRGGQGGHLRLVYGYWDGGDANSPQIFIWDPEAMIKAIDAGNGSAVDESTWPGLAKSRLLWPHFQQQVVERLQRGELYHY